MSYACAYACAFACVASENQAIVDRFKKEKAKQNKTQQKQKKTKQKTKKKPIKYLMHWFFHGKLTVVAFYTDFLSKRHRSQTCYGVI